MVVYMHTYETETGKSFEWNGTLNKRKRSGYIGNYTVNIQLTGDDLAKIQEKQHNENKTVWNSKATAEEDVLKLFGIERPKPKETIKADAKAETEKSTDDLINSVSQLIEKKRSEKVAMPKVKLASYLKALTEKRNFNKEQLTKIKTSLMPLCDEEQQKRKEVINFDDFFGGD